MAAATKRQASRVPSRTSEEKLRAKDEREQLAEALRHIEQETTAEGASRRAGIHVSMMRDLLTKLVLRGKAVSSLSPDCTQLFYRAVGTATRWHAQRLDALDETETRYACRDPKRTYKGTETKATLNPDQVTCPTCLKRMVKFPQLRTYMRAVHRAAQVAA